MTPRKNTRKDKHEEWNASANTLPDITEQLGEPTNATAATESTTADMSGARLFIASVGNPAPYYNTLHSAGHHLLDAMQSTLGYPPFTRSTSSSHPHTLYKSTSQMNISGTNILKAYKTFVSSLPSDERNSARLVIVHDELELPLGQLKLRESGSLKGHNGLKSVQSGLGGKQFARLGVGIGRPESRAPDAVAAYVLRKMTSQERGAIERKGDVAMSILSQLGHNGA